MSILSSYIREWELSRRKDTGKMVLKQRKRFLIFYTFSFCLIFDMTLIGKKKNKEYLPPLYFLCFLISMIVQVVGYFWFQVLFLCEYCFFFDKAMG